MNQITKGLLLQWHTELSQLQASVLMLLLKGRVADFYKDWGVHINSILEKKTGLQREYFVFDGDNIRHSSAENETKTPVMNEGKSYSDFMVAYKALMDEPVGSVILSKA